MLIWLARLTMDPLHLVTTIGAEESFGGTANENFG